MSDIPNTELRQEVEHLIDVLVIFSNDEKDARIAELCNMPRDQLIIFREKLLRAKHKQDDIIATLPPEKSRDLAHTLDGVLSRARTQNENRAAALDEDAIQSIADQIASL